MISYGIMQGRLTQPMGRGIQFFPSENWREEFQIAKEIGLDEIEFIFDYDRYDENPLWTQQGVQELKGVIEDTGVLVRGICFDYFMRRAFYKSHNAEKLKQENITIIKRMIDAMGELGVSLIEIPLVDDSSLKTEEEKALFMDFIREIAGRETGIRFGLETDLPPAEFADYLDEINMKNVGANYDSGNSSGLGYDHYEEVTTLGERIYNIHIKDRQLHGGTKQLGTGSADFDRLFKGLNEINYGGSFILQAARGEEGREKENIVWQKKFVEEYVGRYQL